MSQRTRTRQKSYRTRRLDLREFRLNDWAAWRRAQDFRLPKQNEWDQSPVPENQRSQSLFKRQLLAQRTRFKKNGVFGWSMFLRETGEFIGWVEVSTICRAPYWMANLGWFTIDAYREKGYAKEATVKLISAAFSDLGFHRLEASIIPENTKSMAMARACGLYYEGIKKHYFNQNGVWEDRAVFITTPELFYE